MNKKFDRCRLGLAQALLGAVIVFAFFTVRGIRAGNEPFHLATDWSHRHLVFSPPKSLMHQFQLSSNVRYLQQWVRRNAEHLGDRDGWRWRRAVENPLHGDWSMYLGAGGDVGAAVYPAKFSFDVTTANCGSATQPDFVVYNTGLTPSAASAKATRNGTFSTTTGANGQTATITNPNILAPATNSITLTLSTTVNTGTNFQAGAFGGDTTTIEATNLAAAIVRNGAGIGVTATSAGAVVTVRATNGGTVNNAITLARTVTGFTWAGGTLAGGANGASIVAYDNLYSGCAGTVPSVYWAYNTGGSVVTSVTLSGDGTQVGFVQTVGTAANLVLLKWKASVTDTVDNPTTLAAVTNANYRACTAPCMTTIAFSGAANDTNSSPFYDFAPGSDTMYVGDDNGRLHKFTGVFTGTPAEVTVTWPVTLATATTLTSPVYDQAVGKVFVTNGLPGGATGSLFAVTTAGVVTASAQLSRGLGFIDGPIVDSTNGQVYLATGDVNTAGCGVVNSSILQLSVGFPAGATVAANATEADIGTCNRTVGVYNGDFDNAYYAGGAGHMYACGNAGGTPTLYQIAVSATGNLTAGAATAGPPLATGATTCSSVTEIYNPNATGGAKDWIFVSVQANGKTTAPQSCPSTGGCIMSFDVTSGAAISPATATVGRATAAGGASGVVVDNTVGSGTLSGASQVYFTPLSDGTCATSGGVGGCAIQASQSALQ